MNIPIKLLIFWLTLFGLAVQVEATAPPPIEPFDQAFARFSASYPSNCEDLSREVVSRLTPDAQAASKETIAALNRYVQNIRGDDMHGIQRVLDGESNDILGSWCARLVVDAVGFRRTLDGLVIENMAKSKLRMDEELLAKLRTFWEQERHFSWRFGLEISRALKSSDQ